MTEEIKSLERELKKQTYDILLQYQSCMSTHYASVFASDSRLGIYVNQVIGNYDGHNLYELLAVKRFFEFLDKYEFKINKFKKFCKLYEALKFSGTQGRTRYKLTPVQTFQYANIYGFYIDGVRLCRNAYIFVPRKFSKTTSSAAMAVYELFFGEANAQAYCCANSYNQAKILFDEIRNILLSIDPSERHFKVNRELVSWRDGGKESFCRCLASNPKALDGLFASLCICDEYSQARNTAGKNGADLKNTITSSMGPRKEPLTVVITTASEVIDGPFAHELEGVKSVLRGEVENDRIFASLFMPDVDDKEDDPNTWAKVQPHIGITVQPNFYAEEYKNALLSAENMMVFRTKLLNIFAENETKSWISASYAKEVSKHFDLADFKGRPDAMCAVDLSESQDFTAVSFGIYNYDQKSMCFHTAYFMPEGAIAEHPLRRMLETWHAQGHLIYTKGDVVDYTAVVDYINNANQYLTILQLGYDSWKSTEMLNQFAASVSGASNILKPVSQTYSNFSAAVQSFEHGIKTGKITINDNPINYFCFGNAVIDVDRNDNMKPIKRGGDTGASHANKIDGVITMLMCLRLFIDYER